MSIYVPQLSFRRQPTPRAHPAMRSRIIRYGALEAVQVMRPNTESGLDASVVVE
jgi:hypothetical protein